MLNVKKVEAFTIFRAYEKRITGKQPLGCLLTSLIYPVLLSDQWERSSTVSRIRVARVTK